MRSGTSLRKVQTYSLKRRDLLAKRFNGAPLSLSPNWDASEERRIRRNSNRDKSAWPWKESSSDTRKCESHGEIKAWPQNPIMSSVMKSTDLCTTDLGG